MLPTRPRLIVRRAVIALVCVAAIPLWWLGFLAWAQAMFVAGWMPPAINDSPFIQLPWLPAAWVVNETDGWCSDAVVWSIDCGTWIGESLRE